MKRVCLLFLIIMFLFAGCSPADPDPNPGNYPYEPDTPASSAHVGIFTSEHGSLRFDGDGKSIAVDLDGELAKLTGLPKGKHEGTYVFLSGNLPPNGSFPVRYDIAHEMQIKAGSKSVVIDLGLASEDGQSGQVGVNAVTPERIPMLFHEDGRFFSVVFEKQQPAAGE